MKLHIPGLFDALPAGSSVLIAGCGGGYDVFTGLPIYLALKERGHRVHLANLSFSNHRVSGAEQLGPSLTRIHHDLENTPEYFPEFHLATWLHDHGHSSDVYAFKKTGVRPLRRAYQTLCEELGIDAIILADGGTDSLMFGDECGLGTPHEDATSLIAVAGLGVPAFVCCLGFGIDTFHGVCHAHFLENTAALMKEGAFLGTTALLPQMDEAKAYLDLVRYSTLKTPGHPSIVNESIASAVEGEYGDHHATTRTRGSELWINPLMTIYWSYHLQPLVDRIEYRGMLEMTETFQQVVLFLEPVINRPHGRRPWKAIPS